MKADPQIFDYMPYRDRVKIEWPEGKKLAFWIAPNIEFYELDPAPNPIRKSWAKPHPDVTGYGHRDYGNRAGHWRLMEAMDKHNMRGSVSLSVAMCQHHPEIIESANERQWEFFSHGIYNTRYSYGMDEAQERAIIEDSIKTVRDATGQTIRGWLAPALTHTERTMNLLAEYGIDYTCDLYHDDQPAPVHVEKNRLISMPYSLEVNDHYGFFVYNMSPRQYADCLKRQFDQLLAEGEKSGTVMCVPLHAYLIGQPHRIGPFAEFLDYVAANSKDVWITTAAEIADHYYDNYYDAVSADIARRNGGVK